ncbi:MAG: metallophosphoesterase [Bdellovibrionia bacterium]
MKYVAESVLGMILLLFTGCQTGSTHPSGIQVFPLKDRFPQNDPYHEFRFHAPGRIVAIGDLHGDFAATEGALRVAGAIDASNHWIGGNLVVVQTGDQIDRWDNDREILDFLSNLQQKQRPPVGE